LSLLLSFEKLFMVKLTSTHIEDGAFIEEYSFGTR
jgi:hypothetical protein